MLQLSSNSQQLFAKNGNHVIQIEEPDAATAALVIVQDDQIVHLKAFGVAGGSGRLVTQTSFFTGLTGKSITALAIMQLVEAAKSNSVNHRFD